MEVRRTAGDRNRTLMVLSYDDDFIDRVAALAENGWTIVRALPQAGQIARLVEGGQPDLVIVDVDEAGWSGMRSTDALSTVRAAAPTAPILAATGDLSADMVLAAVRAGAGDVADKMALEDDLADQVHRLLARAAPRPVLAGEGGRSLLVLGPRTGAGTTTLSVALAAELAVGSAGRVLLVDMSDCPAEAPQQLDIATRYGLADATQDQARLDETLIESAFARCPVTGLYVLPLGVGATTPSADPGGFLGLIALLKGFFDWVVIDGRRDWDPPLFDQLFVEADEAILSCDQRLTTVQACTAFVEEAGGRRGTRPWRLVIGRHDPRLLPAAKEIGAIFGQGQPLIVPDARVAVETAHNAGKPLTTLSRRHPFRRSIRTIVETFADTAAGPAAKAPAAVRARRRGAGLFGFARRSTPEAAS